METQFNFCRFVTILFRDLFKSILSGPTRNSDQLCIHPIPSQSLRRWCVVISFGCIIIIGANFRIYIPIFIEHFTDEQWSFELDIPEFSYVFMAVLHNCNYFLFCVLILPFVYEFSDNSYYLLPFQTPTCLTNFATKCWWENFFNSIYFLPTYEYGFY